MLSFWKRLRADTRWVTKLLQLPDAEVREVTGRAVIAARGGDAIKAAGDAREILRALPGFGRGPLCQDQVRHQGQQLLVELEG